MICTWKTLLCAAATLALLMAPAAWAKGKKGPDNTVKNTDARHAAGMLATGEIVSIGPGKLVIRGNKGEQSEFVLNAATEYGRDKAQNLSDFKAGDKIKIIYLKEDGALVAREIISVAAASKKGVKRAKGPGKI